MLQKNKFYNTKIQPIIVGETIYFFFVTAEHDLSTPTYRYILMTFRRLVWATMKWTVPYEGPGDPRLLREGNKGGGGLRAAGWGRDTEVEWDRGMARVGTLMCSNPSPRKGGG